MKKDKLKNHENHHSPYKEKSVLNINSASSNPALSDNFWQNLSKSINVKSANPEVRERVLLAKNILRPVIYDVVQDAFNLIHELNSESSLESYKSFTSICYNIRKFCEGRNITEDQWSLNVLTQLEKDLKDETLQKLQSLKDEKSTDELFCTNTHLLTKLISIHQQLEGVIERLKTKYINGVETIKNIESVKNISKCESKLRPWNLILPGSNKIYLKKDGCNHSKILHKQECGQIVIKNQKSISVHNLPSNIVQPLQFLRKFKSTSSISAGVLFQESWNKFGEKEIVIKCLSDLEKVRRYLEAKAKHLRNERLPNFAGLIKCEKTNCVQPRPHLHICFTGTQLVLKLNLDSPEKERKYDLVIGIPGITSNESDINIHLNRCRITANDNIFQGKTLKNKFIKNVTKISNNITNSLHKKCEPEKGLLQQHNRNNICTVRKSEKNYLTCNKNIKKRIGFTNGKAPELISQNKTNYVFFNTDNPSKSVIKMKERKKYATKVVSNTKLVIVLNWSFYIDLKIIFKNYLFMLYFVNNFFHYLKTLIFHNVLTNICSYLLLMRWLQGIFHKRHHDLKFDEYKKISLEKKQNLSKSINEIIYFKQSFVNQKQIKTNSVVYFFHWLKPKNNSEEKSDSENNPEDEIFDWSGPMPKKSKYYDLPKKTTNKKKKHKNKKTKEVSKIQNETRPKLNEAGDIPNTNVKNFQLVAKTESTRKVTFSKENETNSCEVPRPIINNEEIVNDTSPKLSDANLKLEKVESKSSSISKKQKDITVHQYDTITPNESLKTLDQKKVSKIKKMKDPSKTSTASYNPSRNESDSCTKKDSDTIPIIETSDGRLLSRFYDDKGVPISLLYNSNESLLAEVNPSEIDCLASILFDFKGNFIKYRYNEHGEKIRTVYDANGIPVKKIIVPKKLQQFYDLKGNLIKDFYDWNGYIIKSSDGETISSHIFDKQNRLVDGLFDFNNNKIEKIYSKDGELIASINTKVAQSNESKSHKVTFGDAKKCDSKEKSDLAIKKNDLNRDESIYQFYDEKGRKILKVCNSEGMLLIDTKEGEAEVLFPFLFDVNGRFIRGRYLVNGKEIKAVYDDSGKVISEISIAPLDDSTSDHSSSYEKTCSSKSVVSVHSSLLKKQIDFSKHQIVHLENNKIFSKPPKQLFDKRGNIITRIFDVNGKSLKESKSGDALKLIPYLFDQNGNILDGRYDCFGRILDKVCDKKGTPIENIYLKDVNKLSCVPSKIGTSIHKFYTSKGSLIKRVYDSNGRSIVSCDSGSADKLAPFLFNDNGILFNNIFDSNGKRIKRVYDQHGRVISKVSIHDWSGETVNSNKHSIERYIFTSNDEIKWADCYYDKFGKPIDEVYDDKGKLLVVSRFGKICDLAPFIFDQKGDIKRNLFQKHGRRLVQVYSHKGEKIRNIIWPRGNKNVANNSELYINNFYNSQGSIIQSILNQKNSAFAGAEKIVKTSNILLDEEQKCTNKKSFYKFSYFIDKVYNSFGDIIKSLKKRDKMNQAKADEIVAQFDDFNKNQSNYQKQDLNIKQTFYVNKPFSNDLSKNHRALVPFKNENSSRKKKFNNKEHLQITKMDSKERCCRSDNHETKAIRKLRMRKHTKEHLGKSVSFPSNKRLNVKGGKLEQSISELGYDISKNHLNQNGKFMKAYTNKNKSEIETVYVNNENLISDSFSSTKSNNESKITIMEVLRNLAGRKH